MPKARLVHEDLTTLLMAAVEGFAGATSFHGLYDACRVDADVDAGSITCTQQGSSFVARAAGRIRCKRGIEAEGEWHESEDEQRSDYVLFLSTRAPVAFDARTDNRSKVLRFAGECNGGDLALLPATPMTAGPIRACVSIGMSQCHLLFEVHT